MARSTSDDDTGEQLPAAWTWCTGATETIDLQCKLVRSTLAGAVPVGGKRGATPIDRATQYSSHVPMKTRDLFRLERIRRVLWVNPGPEQRFVSVNVPDSRDQRLIEKNCLDLSCATRERRQQPGRGEAPSQWLDAEFRIERFHVVPGCDLHPPEFSLIGEPELTTISEVEPQMFETSRRSVAIGDEQVSGHSQVDDDRCVTREVEEQVFPPAPKSDELLTCHRSGELGGSHRLDDAGKIEHVHTENRGAR